MAVVDTVELTAKVKDMYRQVAEEPHRTYHFELGRPLADRLGYPADVLDRIPVEAIESFAGVGYFFDLAGLGRDERVIDLGSGSGMDAFFAAAQVGPGGRVVGVDFTVEQLNKARRLAAAGGLDQVEFREGRIEDLPAADESFDCAISNGVINLSAEKKRVFAEATRVLRPGGRLAIADIVSEHQLTDPIVADADLWASCIGGAAQQDAYRQAIESAGLRVEAIRQNPYEFISERARNASGTYGVKSISLLAVKPGRRPRLTSSSNLSITSRRGTPPPPRVAAAVCRVLLHAWRPRWSRSSPGPLAQAAPVWEPKPRRPHSRACP